MSMVTVTADAKNELAEWCEGQWELVTSNPGEGLQPGSGALLDRWRQYAGKCAGTVVFEARLAFLYALLDEPRKAREVLKTVPAAKSDYQYLVDVASLQTEMAEIFASGNANDQRTQLRGLETKYVAFVRRYSDWAQGYFLLGGIQTTLDQHREAIETMIAGLNRVPKEKRTASNMWSVYRHLTVSYAEVGEYRAALHSGDLAHDLKKEITGDPHVMCAAAKAYAGMGDFKSAQSTLGLIALKKPEVKNDPKFLDAQEFVRARMRQKATQQ